MEIHKFRIFNLGELTLPGPSICFNTIRSLTGWPVYQFDILYSYRSLTRLIPANGQVEFFFAP